MIALIRRNIKYLSKKGKNLCLKDAEVCLQARMRGF